MQYTSSFLVYQILFIEQESNELNIHFAVTELLETNRPDRPLV